MRDFLTLEYLKTGNQRQKLAYKDMEQLNVMNSLQEYHPVLAGTIPLGIDVADSDLDIICQVKNLDDFRLRLEQLYGTLPGFSIEEKRPKETDSSSDSYVVASFRGEHYCFEIFGQDLPVTRQNAYRHMMIEYQVLERENDHFRQQVVNLKEAGVKTEPAFAKLLGLKGDDPFEALLQYETMLEQRESTYAQKASHEASVQTTGRDTAYLRMKNN